MNLISNHNHGDTKATQLLRARGVRTARVETSRNAMVVINYAINKHNLAESLIINSKAPLSDIY